MNECKKRCVHVYTGDGKGKSSCAFGLALRCAGSGFRVKIIQFLKTSVSGEVSFINKLGMDNLTVHRFETCHGFTFDMNAEEIVALTDKTKEAISFAKKCITSEECDMLVLDECICSFYLGFISKEDIEELISLSDKTELVFTGRDAPDWLIAMADYVTVMQKKKHPFDEKLDARKGIEF